MKNKITLTDQEAINLSKVEKGKSFLFMRPLEDQPPEGFMFSGKVMDSMRKGFAFNKTYKYFDSSLFENEALSEYRVIPLQYPVGAKLGVRESWARMQHWNDNHHFVYKSDYSIENTYIKTPYNWHSGASMPEDAIRRHVTVVSNTVKLNDKGKWCEYLTLETI